jgi:hypothetical protein
VLRESEIKRLWAQHNLDSRKSKLIHHERQPPKRLRQIQWDQLSPMEVWSHAETEKKEAGLNSAWN